MIKALFESPTALMYAVLVHAVLLAVLIFSFDWQTDEPVRPVNIIKAVAVDESKVADQIEKLKQEENRKRHLEDQHQEKLRQDAERAKQERKNEEQRLAEAKKKTEQQEQLRVQEESRLAAIKKNQAKELQDQAKSKQEQEKLAAQRKAEEKKIQKLKDEERRLADAKAERETLTKNLLDEEQGRLQQQMREEESVRTQDLQAEQNRLNSAKEGVILSKMEEVKARIIARIHNNWRKPTNYTKGLKCTVNVRLMPTGEVLSVVVTQSSGDAAFDTSAEKAVYKSAPFPINGDTDIFDRMRDINFEFEPQQPT